MQQDLFSESSIKTIHDLARKHKLTVDYQLEKESGPAHAKIYTMRLDFNGKEYVGVDRSIKLAQRAAAKAALDEHEHLLLNDSKKETNVSLPPTVTLNTWASQHHIPTRYVLLNKQFFTLTTANDAKHRSYTTFYYRLYLGADFYFDGYGSSNQQARTSCACRALDYIRQNEASILMSCSLTTVPVQPKSKISLMYERARQLGLDVRIEHNEPLTVTYHIGEQYSTTGTGSTKHAAKQNAAEQMLEILPLPSQNDKQKHAHKHGLQHKKFIEQKGSSTYSLLENINPITRLYQIARARDVNIEFVELENSTADRLVRYHVKLGDGESAEGFGKNKKFAKRLAAENLLAKLNTDILNSVESSTHSSPSTQPAKSVLKRDENSSKQEKKHVHFVEDEIKEHEGNKNNRPASTTIKQQLVNACEKLSLTIQYDDRTIAVDNNKRYETLLSLSKDGRLLAQFRASAPSLMRAQESVSLTAWRNLQQLFNGCGQPSKVTTKKRHRPSQSPNAIQ